MATAFQRNPRSGLGLICLEEYWRNGKFRGMPIKGLSFPHPDLRDERKLDRGSVHVAQSVLRSDSLIPLFRVRLTAGNRKKESRIKLSSEPVRDRGSRGFDRVSSPLVSLTHYFSFSFPLSSFFSVSVPLLAFLFP
ncbi:hypothetical protein IE53DRAFT_88997 [Violaceomyces palustris]|uniref:Uncharacterized protein n=1 Tax=Violaceomyces palustris TaxID=1673888 RepID=A0ACD0NXI1_9BASI|nr:hypothetical protein IE53DRAFT_88997 [Violaceomyces palustris]